MERRCALSFTPPLDWNTLLDYYRAHRIEGVACVRNWTHERVFKAGERVGVLQVTQEDEQRPELQLRIFGVEPDSVSTVSQRVRRMFDLDINPLLVERHFKSRRAFRELWKCYGGLRVAKSWDAFEVAIAIILGQVVSVAMGRKLVTQLVSHYGEKVIHPTTGEDRNLFPRPEQLAADWRRWWSARLV